MPDAVLDEMMLHAEQGREWGWSRRAALACFAIGLLAGVAFLWQDWRMAEEAILPLMMFRNNTVVVCPRSPRSSSASRFGGPASIPLYLQIVKGATPPEAGLLLLPMTLASCSARSSRVR